MKLREPWSIRFALPRALARAFRRSAAALVLLGVAAECSTAQTATDVQSRTLAILDSMAAAVTAKDIVRLGELMKDAEYIGAGQVIEPGRFADVVGPSFSQLTSIRQVWGERSIRLVIPRTVVVTARATTTAIVQGQTSVENGLYTIVLVQRDDGVWRIVNVHKTALPMPPNAKPSTGSER